MKKRLNEESVVNELKGSSLFFQGAEKRKTTPLSPQQQGKNEKIKKSKPPIQSTNQLTSRSTSQPTGQSTNNKIDKSVILGRPKAFYITKKQDKDLDIAVEKVAKKVESKVNQKIDRSTVLRLLLEANDITDDKTIDKLCNQLVSQLISQLTG